MSLNSEITCGPLSCPQAVYSHIPGVVPGQKVGSARGLFSPTLTGDASSILGPGLCLPTSAGASAFLGILARLPQSQLSPSATHMQGDGQLFHAFLRTGKS